MLAIVGYRMGEGCHSPFGVTGPTNTQLQQVWAPAFVLLAAVIAAPLLEAISNAPVPILWLAPALPLSLSCTETNILKFLHL